MEETKGQTPELRPNELRSRSDERNCRRQGTEPEKMEKEDSGFGVNEEGQIPDHQVSDAADSDVRESLKEQQRARTPEWTQWRYGHVLSSEYPVRPGEECCLFYLRSGLCGYGSECCYNHPPQHEIQDMIGRKLDCKFFKVGACKRGSHCQFFHRGGRVGAEPAGRTRNLRPNGSGRRCETESRSRAKKREKKDFGFGKNEVGQFRDHQDSYEDAQGILLRQRPRDVEMRKRSRSTGWRASESRERSEDRCQRRHEKELALFNRAREFRLNCVKTRENFQKLTQGNIERQRREAQENLQQQRFQDMPENHNVDAQQNLQEQRKRNIEKERREARLRLDQIQPTVAFDEWSLARELMIEFGYTDFEGSFLGRQEKII